MTANCRTNNNTEEAQLVTECKEVADAWVKFQTALLKGNEEEIPKSSPSIDVVGGGLVEDD